MNIYILISRYTRIGNTAPDLLKCEASGSKDERSKTLNEQRKSFRDVRNHFIIALHKHKEQTNTQQIKWNAIYENENLCQ